jgi:hypothetical protein
MAPRKKPEAKKPDVQPNREQRRREKFGKHGPATHSPDEAWPESVPNPAFGRGGADQAAYTGRPDQDVTRNTGAGAGGATEGDDRIVDREGIHGSNSAKG